MFDQDELHLWMKSHHEHLRSYSSNEMALLAMSCGFSIESVAPKVCDYVIQMKRLLTLWESPFFMNWLNVTSYERGKE